MYYYIAAWFLFTETLKFFSTKESYQNSNVQKFKAEYKAVDKADKPAIQKIMTDHLLMILNQMFYIFYIVFGILTEKWMLYLSFLVWTLLYSRVIKFFPKHEFLLFRIDALVSFILLLIIIR